MKNWEQTWPLALVALAFLRKAFPWEGQSQGLALSAPWKELQELPPWKGKLLLCPQLHQQQPQHKPFLCCPSVFTNRRQGKHSGMKHLGLRSLPHASPAPQNSALASNGVAAKGIPWAAFWGCYPWGTGGGCSIMSLKLQKNNILQNLALVLQMHLLKLRIWNLSSLPSTVCDLLLPEKHTWD